MESVLPPHHLVNHAGVALDDLYNLALLFLPDSIFKWLDDVVIETPCLFLTAHSEKTSIFRLQSAIKSSFYRRFPDSLR